MMLPRPHFAINMSRPGMPASDSVTEFTIRPNSACNDGSWRWLSASLALLGGLIAWRFVALGFWMVLPFMLLELGLFALALWWLLARANYMEKVLVREDTVEIRHLQTGRNARWFFPRRSARVVVRAPRARLHPRKLTVGCGREWVEVGNCLTEAERGALAEKMRRAIRRAAQS